MSSSSSSTDVDQPSRAVIESMQMEIEQLRRRLDAIELHPALVNYQAAGPSVAVPAPTLYAATPTGSTTTWNTSVEPGTFTSTGRVMLALEITPIRVTEHVQQPTAPVPPVESTAGSSVVTAPAENLVFTAVEVYPEPNEPAQPAPKRRCRTKMMPKKGGNIDPMAMESEDPEAIETLETLETAETAKVEESSESSESLEVVHDSRDPTEPEAAEPLKRKCSVVLRKMKVPKRRASSSAVDEHRRQAPPSSIEVPEEDWELPAEPEPRPRRGQTTSEIKEALEQLREARKRKKKD